MKVNKSLARFLIKGNGLMELKKKIFYKKKFTTRRIRHLKKINKYTFIKYFMGYYTEGKIIREELKKKLNQKKIYKLYLQLLRLSVIYKSTNYVRKKNWLMKYFNVFTANTGLFLTYSFLEMLTSKKKYIYSKIYEKYLIENNYKNIFNSLRYQLMLKNKQSKFIRTYKFIISKMSPHKQKIKRVKHEFCPNIANVFDNRNIFFFIRLVKSNLKVYKIISLIRTKMKQKEKKRPEN